MTDASQARVPPAPDASSSDPGLARLSGVFFSPVATLESIAHRPTWVGPLLLWTGLSVAVTGGPPAEDRLRTADPAGHAEPGAVHPGSLCLFVIGFAAAARVKRGAAAGVIVTLWLLTVAIRVGWNAIF